jgi:hypothetical protein
MDNLLEAHKNARENKSYYREVKYVDEHRDECLEQLHEMLVNHTYRTSEYKIFERVEHGKNRTIYALPYFPDRVCQWALMQVIGPCLVNSFTADTYSAIPKRGIYNYGLDRVKQDMYNDKEGCKFCLKFDIKHYYQSINHTILKGQYADRIKDKDVLLLINEIIDSINTATEEDLKRLYPNGNPDYETGIPIGNYLSQYSGNLYLSEFDHWIKEVKHIKYYHRYMDDCVIFGSTKEELHKLLEEIKLTSWVIEFLITIPY